MKSNALLFTLLILLNGCERRDGSSDSLDGGSDENVRVEDLLEKDEEVTFASSSEGLGSWKLIFQRGGNVLFDSFAYNICKFPGTFREEEGEILISFDMDRSYGGLPFKDKRTDPDVILLPALELQNTSEGIVLIRKDGRTDLSEHWNIYPEDVESVFPFRIVTMDRAEQVADDQLPDRAESEAE